MNAHTDLIRQATAIAPNLLFLSGEPCAIYCFRALDAAVIARGAAEGAEWTALSWSNEGQLHALAILASIPFGEVAVHGEHGQDELRIIQPGRVTSEPGDLARFLVDTGAPMGEVLRTLDAAIATGPGTHAYNRFVAILLREVSKADGFVEIAVRPECGGLFLQGWAHAPLRGALSPMGEAAGIEAIAAGFDREDILAPASGFCLYLKDWDERLDDKSVFFVDFDDRPLRLDVLEGATTALEGRTGTDHVQAMLPKLAADEVTLAGFRRICRPRFTGVNTLAEHPDATTAAIDRILQTPSGGLFVTGWLLDPLAQVERAILKSTANLYAPLHENWHRVERPDLNEAFGDDPRFAGLLDPRERLHGFVCAVQADPAVLDGAQVYLELEMSDRSCLFLPCELTPCAGHGAAHPVIGTLATHDPALSTLISRHAAPFLETVPVRRNRQSQVSMQPLGGGFGKRNCCALMPVSDIAHIQPVMASIAGTPEASALDFALVIGREGAVGLAEEIDDAFRFYGLRGALMLVPDHETLAARLDVGAGATDAESLLVWQPTVLPKAPGWLDELRNASETCEGPAVVSPLLTYEDGSVYFGGSATEDGPEGAVCALVGFERRRIAAGQLRPAKSFPAEIALMDRALLSEAGGFAGRLWGDRFIGQDLSLRLGEAGARPWCASQVEFWMLETSPPEQPESQRMIDRIDAALIARRKAPKTEC